MCQDWTNVSRFKDGVAHGILELAHEYVCSTRTHTHMQGGSTKVILPRAPEASLVKHDTRMAYVCRYYMYIVGPKPRWKRNPAGWDFSFVLLQ